MIKTVLHDYRYSNTGKLAALQQALLESFYVKLFYIDYYWNLYSKSEDCITPFYYDYKVLTEKDKSKLAPSLTWRAINSICDDAKGSIKANLNKKRNLIFKIKNIKEENIKRREKGLCPFSLEKLESDLENFILTKPEIKLNNHSLEVSSKCIQFIKRFNPISNLEDRFIESLNPELIKNNFKHFDLFMKISLIEGNPIYIPVKLNNQDFKMLNLKGELLCGVELRMKSFDFRYEIPNKELKKKGKIVGADSGISTILTLSDGQATNNKYNLEFKKVLTELSLCEKGTKKFKRLQDQRKNIINNAINELDFSKIKQINLEHISNLFYKNNVNAIIARFTNTLIEAKLQSICELKGVLLNLQESAYYSQRCHSCGLVKKNNRNKKDYKCCNPHCKNHFVIFDADLNSALNHELELPMIPKFLFRSKQNVKGFFWKEEGFFNIGSLDYEVGDSLIEVISVESNFNQQQDFIGSASALPSLEIVIS
jgi:transposase